MTETIEYKCNKTHFNIKTLSDIDIDVLSILILESPNTVEKSTLL